MGNIKIAVVLKNKEHCNDLIRRLAELAEGLEFVISDAGEKSAEDADFIVNEQLAAEFFPVCRLAEKIADNLGSRFIACLGCGRSSTRTYVIRGGFGGAGCTALGLTIARILAGRSGGRIAFISCGGGTDAFMYAETANYMFRVRELSYRLKHGMDIEIEKYSFEDRYGVTIFGAEDTAVNLSEYLQKQNFNAVVIDAGCMGEGKNAAGQAVINIEAWGDSRATDFEQRAASEIAGGSREFFVLNKAPYRMTEGRIIKVSVDSSSFVKSGEKIEIAMDKAFAASVRDLVTAVEKELDDGQSDFYK